MEPVEVGGVVEDHVVPAGPVARVLEDDEARRDAHLLQVGEERERLRVGDAEVLLAGDHERRRPELLDVRRRALLRVPRGVLPGGPLQVPLGEPELLGHRVHRPQVVDAHHRGERLEVVVVPGEPHHRVAAPRPAHRPDPVLVGPRLHGEPVGHGDHVLHHLAVPVARDRGGEVLSPAGRAVRVREGDDVARARVDLRVAPERVGPLHLRAAVDVHDHGVLLRRVEAVRLDEEDLDLLARRAVDVGLLHRAEVDLGDERLVLEREGRRRSRRLSGERHLPELGRQVHLPPREDGPGPVAGDLERVDVPDGRGDLDRARGEVEVEERRPPLHVGEEEDPLSVRVEAVVADPRVERLGEDAARAGRPVEEGEEEAVRLVPGGPLHPEGDRLPVGGVLRGAVEGRVLRGEVLRRLQLLGRAVHRDDEDVDVRREGGVRVAARREGELLPVGRDVEVGAAADGEGGGVEVAGRQVDERGLRVGEVHPEDVRPLAVLPGVPVPHEEGVGEDRLHLPLLHRLVLLLVAVEVGAAGGPDVGDEEEAPAVGREAERADAPGDVGLLLGLAPGDRQEPDLRRAGAGGEEGERRAVGRERRARVALVEDRQGAGVLPVGVDAPEVRPALDGRQVGRRDGEGDAPSVGRDDGLGHPLHLVEVVDRHGPLLGSGGEGKSGQRRAGRLRRRASGHSGRLLRAGRATRSRHWRKA